MAQREHLLVAAERGSEAAKNALAGPDCPEALRYLLRWAQQLHGRSGVGMSGFAPLSWSTLDAWARWSGACPDAEDVEALFTLDAVMLSPGAGSGSEAQTKPEEAK